MLDVVCYLLLLRKFFRQSTIIMMGKFLFKMKNNDHIEENLREVET